MDQQRVLHAFQILTKAAQGYVLLSDDLTKAFVAPQIKASIEILDAVLSQPRPRVTDDDSTTTEGVP